jgi:hyperosmotically inducible protein
MRITIACQTGISAIIIFLITACHVSQNEISGQERSKTNASVDDAAITTRIKSLLYADPDLRHLSFDVLTIDGQVELNGLVDTEAQINRAIAIGRLMEGVTHVNNRIRTKSEVVGEADDKSIKPLIGKYPHTGVLGEHSSATSFDIPTKENSNSKPQGFFD